MLINDPIYGEFNIEEQVLIDIINSKELQRLKQITPSGFYPAYPKLSYKFNSRYSHSIGVFLLLRKYGASLEEQIAGLIHDVSHTSFSHTIDYVVGSISNQKKQDKQDMGHEDFIRKSSIFNILKKYDYDIKIILDDTKWTLKENNIPNICADRIDYSLRDGYLVYNIITKKDIDNILNSLINYNGSFVFSEYKWAEFFAEYFWEIDEKYYSGLRSATMFAMSAKFFKLAILKGYIKIEEFYDNDDQYILDKIENMIRKDSELNNLLKDLYLPIDCYENNKTNYIEHVFCKVRRIDPFFIENNNLIKVSEVNSKYKNKLDSLNKYNEYFINKKQKQ